MANPSLGELNEAKKHMEAAERAFRAAAKLEALIEASERAKRNTD